MAKEEYNIVIEGIIVIQAENKAQAREETETWLEQIIREVNQEEAGNPDRRDFHVHIDESFWED